MEEYYADHARARKQAAVQFLKLVVAGSIDEAYEKYIDMQGRHHNPFFPAGFPALKKAMTENHVQFPNRQYNDRHQNERTSSPSSSVPAAAAGRKRYT